jgi:hypothetical protein
LSRGPRQTLGVDVTDEVEHCFFGAEPDAFRLSSRKSHALDLLGLRLGDFSQVRFNPVDVLAEGASGLHEPIRLCEFERCLGPCLEPPNPSVVPADEAAVRRAGEVRVLRVVGEPLEQRRFFFYEEIAALVAQSQKRSAVFDVITNPTDVAVTTSKA